MSAAFFSLASRDMETNIQRLLQYHNVLKGSRQWLIATSRHTSNVRSSEC